MGLDMYLTRRTYVGRDERNKSNVNIKGVDGAKVKYVDEDAGYWRKANHIHRWFVENVQGGQDDCREYYVSREQLGELLKTVNRVLASSKLVKGKVENGYGYEKDAATGEMKRVPYMEDGEYIED